jgi:type IV pilus assembly protein PilX
MRPLRYSLHQQSGIVLIVSFIILLLLTIIGISGMKVTGLEEKMAGNDRDQNVAFQSAEAALRAGEARIDTIYSDGNGSISSFCGNTVGLYHEVNLCTANVAATKANAPNAFDSETWTDKKSVAVASVSTTASSSGNKLVTAAPRYFITYVAIIPPVSAGASPAYLFTVTARGLGGQDGSQVVLRSHFGGPARFAD